MHTCIHSYSDEGRADAGRQGGPGSRDGFVFAAKGRLGSGFSFQCLQRSPVRVDFFLGSLEIRSSV